jgi:hypothetical protein
LDQLFHPVRAEPLRDHHKERRAVFATQHARVAGAIEFYPIEHLTTLADTQTNSSLIRSDVAAPHRAFGVDADPLIRK